MTQTQIHATISPCTPILSADPTVKEDANRKGGRYVGSAENHHPVLPPQQ